MSRFRARKENLTLHYGTDHVLGYWYDITDSSSMNEDGEPKVIEEKCTLFDNLTAEEFCEVLVGFGLAETFV